MNEMKQEQQVASNKILSLKNIQKIYMQAGSAIEILQDVNLEIFSGEMVAIIGSSGSGKSTLLQIAGLLDDPTHGEVLYYDDMDFQERNAGSVNAIGAVEQQYKVNGKNKNITSSAARNNKIRLHNIGFIYQYHHLLKDFNARENVALPRIIAGHDYAKALADADRLLALLGLETKIYNMPGELSGGQQQRVAIARSLINNPKIILADEPTGNLDPHNADEVFNLFLEVARNKNTAVVMVTHNIAIAERMNKVMRLEYGILDQ